MTLSRPSNNLKRAMPHSQDIANACGLHNRNAFQPETPHQRCKRRLNMGHLGYMVPSNAPSGQNPGNGMPTAVAKRNERERKRVRMVNNGFTTLRQHVPSGAKNKKLSKVETLRSAIDYIKHLQQVLGVYDMPTPTQNPDIDLSLDDDDDEQTSPESSQSECRPGGSPDGADENVFPAVGLSTAETVSSYSPNYGCTYPHMNVPTHMDNQYSSSYANLDMCQYPGSYSPVQMGNCSVSPNLGVESNCHNVGYAASDELLTSVTTWFT